MKELNIHFYYLEALLRIKQEYKHNVKYLQRTKRAELR